MSNPLASQRSDRIEAISEGARRRAGCLPEHEVVTASRYLSA